MKPPKFMFLSKWSHCHQHPIKPWHLNLHHPLNPLPSASASTAASASTSIAASASNTANSVDLTTCVPMKLIPVNNSCKVIEGRLSIKGTCICIVYFLHHWWIVHGVGVRALNKTKTFSEKCTDSGMYQYTSHGRWHACAECLLLCEFVSEFTEDSATYCVYPKTLNHIYSDD